MRMSGKWISAGEIFNPNQFLNDLFKVRKYRGFKHGYYTIRSCFGGENEEFLATGSEDNLIYIFHRDKETPLVELEGHGE